MAATPPINTKGERGVAAELKKKDIPAVRHRLGIVGERLSEYDLTVRLRSNYRVYVTVLVRDRLASKGLTQWTHGILASTCAVGRAI